MKNQTLSYMISLANKHRKEVGFIPTSGMRYYFDRGQYLISKENDEPNGFITFGSTEPNLKIVQTVIQYDSQRRLYGQQLVARLERFARENGFKSISLKCANDLPANEFWIAEKFNFVKATFGGFEKNRILNHWIKIL